MTEEHRTVISVKCSHPKKKKKLPFLPTFRPIEPRLLSDNPDPSPSLFKHIIEKTPLPADAFKWNRNNAVQEAGRKLKPALDLIKIGKENDLQFAGLDSNAADTEAVTRLKVFHYPPGLEAKLGILHAVGDASVASNYTMNTVTHQDVNIFSMTQGVGLDDAYPVFEGTTAFVDVFPYGMPADMCSNKNGEAYKKYVEVCKEIRYVVKEYIKAVTQLFPNLRDITFYGEAFNFLQDNPGMVDPRMVTQLELDVGGLAHSSTARMGTREEHSIAQLKVSGTYYGDMLQNSYVFDPNDPKTEMFIQSTPRLMMDEVKHRENIKASLANRSDEDKANQMATRDKKREDDIPGLITVTAGSEHSILTQCTNPKCDNNKQRQTNQIISKEDAGCDNVQELGSSYDVYKASKEDKYAEYFFTTSSTCPSNEIETKLKSRHDGQYVYASRTIRSRIADGTGIEVKTSTYGDPVATYFTKKSTTTDMIMVLPRCSNCNCTMFPVDESQKRNTISLITLYVRRDRGLLPTKEEKSKAKKGKKRKKCTSGV